MTYTQQLAWLEPLCKLNEYGTFILDMHMHLTALQLNTFVFDVASRLIQTVQYQDNRKIAEAERDRDNSQRNTKYLDEASTLLAAITATEGGTLHTAERVVAEQLYDFALLVEHRIGLKQSLIDCKAVEMLLLGLQTQGAHHKQYALYKLAQILGLEHFMSDIKDKGIAP